MHSQEPKVIHPRIPFFDKNIKPQKFFYRDLNLDLNHVSNILHSEYNRILNSEMRKVRPFDAEHPENEIFKESNSISTIKSREYNAFKMYYPFIHDLYSSIVDMVFEACEYYNIDYNSQRYMCQAWFNINNKNNGGKLNWHDHIQTGLGIPAFHGYYCVSAEPSETHYNINGEVKTNNNKNNRAVLSLAGFPHAMGEWDWEGSRITIAYDILPLDLIRQEDFLNWDGLKEHESFWEQHYFPLPQLKSLER